MSGRPPASRSGFTLLELLVALSLGAILLIGGRLLFEQLDSLGEASRLESTRADEIANGSRLLRALLSMAEVVSDTSQQFSGDDANATFSTWCEVPAGWLEHCIAHLRATANADSTVVTVSFDGGTVVPLWRTRGAAQLRYYGRTGEAICWVATWSSIAAPLAVGIVREAGDTTVFPIGARS